ncbi:MAG: alpha-2-macroglobulin, partial [bacterium]|nr:alpha-2-macroglobulin [bacterium]
DVEENDQPNFFVEAYTVYDGQLHHQVRRIVVPPTERMLQVSMEADKEEYLPGEEATVVMRVQTPDGKPAVGSIAIAAFDRSLEQIAPDVLPPDIREFFWKWEWQHYPSLKHGLSQQVYPCQIEGVPALQYLGIFGSFLADDLDVMEGIHDRQTQLGYQSMQNRGLELQSAEMRGGGMMQPMAAAMEQADMGALAVRSVAAADAKMAGAAPAAGQEIGVRKNFADSAVWLANVETDEQGLATARFDLPESLTSWRIAGWAVGQDTQVGSVKSSVVTRKPLLLRLQTPRFLVEQDEVVISAIVHNDTNTPKSVKVWVEIDGQTQLELLPETSRELTIDIGAFEQQRVDWRCKALAEGTVTVKSFALADDASDAMQLDIPIVVHGSLTTQSWAGTIRTEQQESSIAVRIPAERRAEHSRLTIRLSPSLALSMMDSLPYLAEYPYGCTEQTLNRFLPAVLTRKVLQDMQIDLQALANQRSNLNAQELGSPEERRAQWGSNPIYDPDKLDDMIRSGLQKLSEMQNSDGGWGWFSGVQSRSSAHITALIVRGLVLARDSGVAIVPDTLLRGDQWLAQYQRTQLELLSNAVEDKSPSKRFPDNTDALVLHSLLMANMAAANDSDAVNAMQKALYEHRKELSIYGKSLLALATRQLQLTEQVAMLKANIEQFLVQDQENETAFLADETSAWYWYGSAIEANAMYLKLLAEEDPQGITAPRLVKYLLNNRKHASYWNSTRDTALVVEAFAEYLQASQETAVDMSVEVLLDDKRIGSVDFSTD